MINKIQFLLVLVILSLLPAEVSSQIDSNSVRLQDEGSTLGQVKTVNCVGAGIACTRSASTGTVTVSGGGGGSSVTRIAGSSGAAGADITWQRLTANSADVTTTTLSAAVVTTTGVGAGTWKFKYILLYQTAATTTGISFGINHTGTVSKVQAIWTHITTGGTAATGVGDNVAATVAGQLAEGKSGGTLNAVIGSASAGVATINTDIVAVLEGTIVVTATGSLELKIASEVSGSAARIMANSLLELHAF